MTVNITTLMTRLGHFFFVGESANTTLGSTVPTRVDAALSGLGSSLSAQYETVRDSVLAALTTLQQAGASGSGGIIQQPCNELIRLTVSDDQPMANTLDLAVRELIKQFEDGSESFDASTVGSSLAYDAGNVGNGVAVVSTKRSDGKSALFSYAEAINIDFSQTSSGETTFSITGKPSVDLLMPTWPGGSGADETTTSKTSSSGDNLLGTNGTFEDNDDQSVNLPKGWLAPVATLGTTLKMGSVEQQTVVIAGGPASGFYTLSWVNGAGQTQTTVPLSFDAGQDTVQTALQALAGLSAVTVSTSGMTPNYTHTITFTGVTNPAQLTSTSNLNTGTITHNTTVSGSANVFRGARAVEFASNGSQLTTIQIPVTLIAQTQYVFNVFIKASTAAPAAGVLTFDLVDGVGGTVLNDDAGTANSFTFGHASFTTSFQAVSGVFRTPLAMPSQVYLRIRISTAVTNAVSVYFDEVYLGQMTEIYTDGPSVALFDGSAAWLAGDRIVLTVTNDRAGLLHEWLDRILSLRENRLIFPTNSVGGETQPDSLVA